MDNLTFWLVVVFAGITLYRLLSQRVVTPKARVTEMLRRYRALEKRGLSEQEALLQLLATRRHWKRLPPLFLAELVKRFRSKEDVMRFVSVSEDYRYHREHYPDLAATADLEQAIAEVACLFARFGLELQAERRYKEAEFVQKLALKLQPDQYFTNLPLAATYHDTGQHAEALPLFERGLAHCKNLEVDAAPSLPKCFGPDAEVGKLRKRYQKMYEACRKALGVKSA